MKLKTYSLRDGISYGFVAHMVGQSKTHVYLVCQGKRISKSLIHQLLSLGLIHEGINTISTVGKKPRIPHDFLSIL